MKDEQGYIQVEGLGIKHSLISKFFNLLRFLSEKITKPFPRKISGYTPEDEVPDIELNGTEQ